MLKAIINGGLANVKPVYMIANFNPGYAFMQIIEEFQKCHIEHPIAKFFGECTDLKIKLDRCFRQEVSFSFSLFVVFKVFFVFALFSCTLL